MGTTSIPWKIELHGGGSTHKWREVGQAKPRQAKTQAQILIDRARQGGVRVLNDKGEVVTAWWRRHAPGARPEPISFCIGCGCHEFNACIDENNAGGGCMWLAKEGNAGVCSCCIIYMKRWNAGDRRMQEWVA